jgi:hypothetical protein
MLDETAILVKVRYLYGEHVRRCGGHKREGRCALPGEIYQPAKGYHDREIAGGVGRSQLRPY